MSRHSSRPARNSHNQRAAHADAVACSAQPQKKQGQYVDIVHHRQLTNNTFADHFSYLLVDHMIIHQKCRKISLLLFVHVVFGHNKFLFAQGFGVIEI